MHIIASVAMSLDGYIDDATGCRLTLSHFEDLAAVQALRDTCDAIFVGAETIRKDNPSLATRDEAQRRRRVAAGLSPEPMKITLTRSGNLPQNSRFFRDGDGVKRVYHLASSPAGIFPKETEVGCANNVGEVVADLERQRRGRLLVEGGTTILTEFLTAGLIDEMRIAVAPFFVGDAAAPRFVLPGPFPHDSARRMILKSAEAVGDMAVLNYHLERTS